jgi:hypothetical protein
MMKALRIETLFRYRKFDRSAGVSPLCGRTAERKNVGDAL